MDRKLASCKKAREIWPKIIEITRYWKSLPESRQPVYDKVGNNSCYDHLFTSVNDPLIPVKINVCWIEAKETSSRKTRKRILDPFSNCWAHNVLVIFIFSWCYIFSYISPLSKEKYIQMYYLAVYCYKQKLKLYLIVIGIWVAATVETRNGKCLG